MNKIKIKKSRNSFRVSEIRSIDLGRDRDSKGDAIAYGTDITNIDFKNIPELRDYLKKYNENIEISDIVKCGKDHIILSSTKFVDSADLGYFRSVDKSGLIKRYRNNSITYYCEPNLLMNKVLDITKPIYKINHNDFKLNTIMNVLDYPKSISYIELMNVKKEKSYHRANNSLKLRIHVTNEIIEFKYESSDYVTQDKTAIKTLANKFVDYLDNDINVDTWIYGTEPPLADYRYMLNLYKKIYPDIIVDEFCYIDSTKRKVDELVQIIHNDGSVTYRFKSSEDEFDKSRITLISDKSNYIESLRNRIKSA